MSRDRWLLIVAYVLLVTTVAWQSWDTQRALDRIGENVCATAEVVVANQLFNLATYGQQEGVNEDVALVAIETYVTIAEAVQERCGSIFLDDIPVPTLPE